MNLIAWGGAWRASTWRPGAWADDGTLFAVLRSAPLTWTLLNDVDRAAPLSWTLLTAAEQEAHVAWSMLAPLSKAAELAWDSGGYVASSAQFGWAVGGVVWHTPHLTLRVAQEIRSMIVAPTRR
jgi:hypothetical protein